MATSTETNNNPSSRLGGSTTIIFAVMPLRIMVIVAAIELARIPQLPFIAGNRKALVSIEEAIFLFLLVELIYTILDAAPILYCTPYSALFSNTIHEKEIHAVTAGGNERSTATILSV